MPGIMINSLSKRPGQKQPSLFASTPTFSTRSTVSRRINDSMSQSSSCHSRSTTTRRSREVCENIMRRNRYSDCDRAAATTSSNDAFTVASSSTSSSTSSSRSSSTQPSPKNKHQHRYASLWGTENANEKGTWGHFIDFEHSNI